MIDDAQPRFDQGAVVAPRNENRTDNVGEAGDSGGTEVAGSVGGTGRVRGRGRGRGRGHGRGGGSSSSCAIGKPQYCIPPKYSQGMELNVQTIIRI